MINDGQAARDELLDTWASLLEARARLERALASDVMASAGVAMPTAEVLMRLLQVPSHSLPTTQLARDVSFTSGGFTKFVDRLVAGRLVERRPSAEDRRVVQVALTDEGLTVARKTADALVAGLERHALEPLGHRRLVALGELLRRLDSGIKH